MAADWEEVKRLAADFQRAQLSSTVQRLSERNCIEIVKKLIELKLIDVIFTSDGKEYLTPSRLLKEIRDELFVHGGRINLVELSQILGVDFSHVESKANEFAKSEPGIRLILGQLITKDYLDHLAEEVNEKLQQTGQITIGELTKTYDLPGDFLEEVVYERLGTFIQAQPDAVDSRTFFTPTYISQHAATIRGILSGVTRPVLASNIINHFQIPERLFYSVVDDLVKNKRIAGSMSAWRSDKAMYVPDIYARGQNEWVDAFYKQNGYLEYDSLSRLGITDAKSHIKKRFKDDQLTFLSSCCVGKSILSQVESAIEEALNSGSMVDIMPILPSVFSLEDCHQLIKLLVKSVSKPGSVIRIYANSVVVSDAVIQNCMASFESLMTKKAQEDIQEHPNLFLATQSSTKPTPAKKEDVSIKGKPEKKDDRKKKNVGKSGGGTQGRESKIRAVKKKYRTGKSGDANPDSDEEASFTTGKEGHNEEFEFLDISAIVVHLRENIPLLQDFDEELVTEIAEELHRPLAKKYEEVARELYAATVATSASARRKQYAEFQEKLNSLLPHIYLVERSVKFFSEEVATQLNKYLLKTLCTDVINMIVALAAQEHGLSSSSELNADLTPEARLKMIDKLPDDLRQPLKKLHNSLNSKTLVDFFENIDGVLATDICNSVSRKLDKKKERQILSNHRQSLLGQLSETNDPALCLHLAVLLLFQTQTHNILHASGKFVPHIIGYLQKHIPFYQELAIYQEHVIKQLTASGNEEEEQKTLSFLTEMMPKVKEYASTYKKSTVSESEN